MSQTQKIISAIGILLLGIYIFWELINLRLSFIGMPIVMIGLFATSAILGLGVALIKEAFK